MNKKFEIRTVLPNGSPAAQGDLLVFRVSKLPEGAVEQKREGRLVVAHSETGHHHAIDNVNVSLFTTTNPLVSFLKVKDQYADIVHHRPFDTHETLRLDNQDEPEVIWEIRRQRESVPEGFRIVAD